MAKLNYVNLDRIQKTKSHYNVLLGERSNGKTSAVLEEGLKRYLEKGDKMALLRRWKEDFRGKRGAKMWDGIVERDLIRKYSNGEFDRVHYYASQWWLARYNKEIDQLIKDKEPFCYGFALSEMEHDKSTAYPDITLIMMDEVVSRTMYLTDEFVIFCNVLSTIIRQRDNVVIYLLGNTVNKYCPYFKEMGLHKIKEMRPGDLHVYKYGNSQLQVAVQFTDSISKKGKASDVYFAFDNPKLQMITGKGQIWEMENYPHSPCKYEKKDILYSYFILFDAETLQADIIMKEEKYFTFIHRKTTELKEEPYDLIFSTEEDPRPNYRRKITKPMDRISKKVAEFFLKDKVFYQDNEVGEIVRNYLKWCKSSD